MATVTSDLVKTVLAGVRTDFQAAYMRKAPDALYRQLATVVPTTLPTQDYAWLGANPTMREHIDETAFEALKEMSWSISDKEWDAGLMIQRKALEDDQYGLIRMRTQGLADEPLRHRVQMVTECLALGATTAGPDGVYFIGTTHAESGSNQSNKSTNALSESEVAAGIVAMMGFVDNKDVPMGIVPNILAHGPKNEFIADRICRSPNVIASALGSTSSAATIGDRNALNGRLTPVCLPYLRGTYDDYWFLLDTTRPVRAVILQERSDVVDSVEGVTDPNDSYVIIHNEFPWKVRGRYNVGLGLWQTAFGGIL